MRLKFFRHLKGWRRVIILASLLLIGCAEAVPAKKPVSPIEKPLAPPVKEEPVRRISSLVEMGLIDQFIHEVELDLNLLERKKEEFIAKGAKEPQLTRISGERERLLERKRILEEIKKLEIDFGRAEDLAEQERLQKEIARRLLELFRICPKFSIEPERLLEKERVDTYQKVQDLFMEVQKAYREQRFNDVVKSYKTFKGNYPEVKIPGDIRAHYAISLYKGGNIDEAINELREAIDEKALQADPQYLRYLLGNWLHQSGRTEEALKAYKAVEAEAGKKRKWGDLAQVKIRLIEVGKGKTASTRKEEKAPAKDARRKEEDELSVGEDEEKGPPSVSRAYPERGTPRGTAEEDERKKEEARKILDEGNALFENEKFEDAIKVYRKLAGTPYEENGKQRIQESMDRYADRARKEASELFLKGIKITDTKEKRELLLRSLQILKGINEKYPENRYAEKVKAYIQSVIKELKKVSPDFKE